ncbi:hypothetical protein [Massilia terrae]|uniref:Secreted protein n=1 Tax=Massilia terrae TaxID=1811224 RepID=A0ABT2D6Z3_9BURK|nr:hypothetical protein [Massilia terrae]MCS0661115.1 hypothetical protein [Massilia terrae]
MAKLGLFYLAVAALLLAASDGNAHERKCTAREASEADAMVDQLHSWKTVDAVFRRYSQCDSGSIAEGNSEAVARLLVDKWNTLPALVHLAKSRPGLRRFVVVHVDSTLNTSDLERIIKLSATSCPKGAAGLCDELHTAATAALGEQAPVKAAGSTAPARP